MSRDSQNHFDHAVPRVNPNNYQGPRISITYRALRTGATAQATNTVPQANNNQRSPKRVLILSDS